MSPYHTVKHTTTANNPTKEGVVSSPLPSPAIHQSSSSVFAPSGSFSPIINFMLGDTHTLSSGGGSEVLKNQSMMSLTKFSDDGVGPLLEGSGALVGSRPHAQPHSHGTPTQQSSFGNGFQQLSMQPFAFGTASTSSRTSAHAMPPSMPRNMAVRGQMQLAALADSNTQSPRPSAGLLPHSLSTSTACSTVLPQPQPNNNNNKSDGGWVVPLTRNGTVEGSIRRLDGMDGVLIIVVRQLCRSRTVQPAIDHCTAAWFLV